MKTPIVTYHPQKVSPDQRRRIIATLMTFAEIGKAAMERDSEAAEQQTKAS